MAAVADGPSTTMRPQELAMLEAIDQAMRGQGYEHVRDFHHFGMDTTSPECQLTGGKLPRTCFFNPVHPTDRLYGMRTRSLPSL